MKRIALTIALAVFFFFPWQTVTAAIDCSAPFEQSSRTLRGCIGGVSSETELRGMTVKFNCLANSNTADAPILNNLSACRGVSSFSLSFTNAQIEKDAKGYWACPGTTGINRALGRMEAIFTDKNGGQVCKVNDIYTKPPDWNSLSEGMPLLNDESDAANICQYANNSAECIDCFVAKEGVWTAIGCIPTTPQGLFTKFFPIGIGMAGGIAFLLILFGGFQILTSAGNPEQLNEGRELVSSAVAGLLLIIFSVFLLRLIGYDILRIPGFSG